MSEDTKRKHWFCFSFTGIDTNDGLPISASSYTGYPNKFITMARISENKHYAGVTESAVLIACSYLGYLSKSEFVYTPDQPPHNEEST